ncbi:MAG: hypothetical protein DDT35_01063 [Firmicutes bacterium]|nr:hypothetical protein [Bacillota bacterium]
MPHFGEARKRAGGHPLRGRCRHNKFGVPRLEIAQFFHETVIVMVRYEGGV